MAKVLVAALIEFGIERRLVGLLIAILFRILYTFSAPYWEHSIVGPEALLTLSAPEQGFSISKFFY
jgi:hypothetical protein